MKAQTNHWKLTLWAIAAVLVALMVGESRNSGSFPLPDNPTQIQETPFPFARSGEAGKLCRKIAAAAFAAAQSRDDGVDEGVAIDSVDSVPGLDGSARDALMNMVAKIYDTPKMTPDDERSWAFKGCYDGMMREAATKRSSRSG
ncbi:MAG: hypothetical protein ABSC63_04315 [Candidatus Binataceae bacterium]|jgi:hypothetical protein